MIKKAVILCGGLATRLLPVTKSIPKEMMPILDKPMLHYIMDDLIDNGIEDIIIVIGRGKECIENYVDRNIELENRLKANNKLRELDEVNHFIGKANITFVRQIDAKGTGYAIERCKNLIGNDNFLMVFGDEILFNNSTAKQLISAFDKCQKSTISLRRVPMKDVSKYGNVQFEERPEGIKIHEIVEKPKIEEAFGDMAYVGASALTSEVFNYIDKIPQKNGEYCLTDAFTFMAKDGILYGTLLNGDRHDIGNKLGYVKASIFAGLNDPEIKDDVKEYILSLLK